MIDRDRFFQTVRDAPFNGFSQEQVDGLNAILDQWDARLPNADPRFLAYMLATAFHETAETMQPIREHGGEAYFHKMYDPNGARPKVAEMLGNTFPGDGVRYHGRGYVQLTGKANYFKASQIFQIDFLGNPDWAMDPHWAASIMFAGMTKGWFTGKKLADYFDADSHDPLHARKIINGMDKAEKIAGHFENFMRALA